MHWRKTGGPYTRHDGEAKALHTIPQIVEFHVSSSSCRIYIGQYAINKKIFGSDKFYIENKLG